MTYFICRSLMAGITLQEQHRARCALPRSLLGSCVFSALAESFPSRFAAMRHGASLQYMQLLRHSTLNSPARAQGAVSMLVQVGEKVDFALLRRPRGSIIPHPVQPAAPPSGEGLLLSSFLP